MKRSQALPLLVGAALCATPAASQEGWQVSASAYLWLPETTTTLDTRFGAVTTELGRADAVDALDAGIMGTISAQSGPWSLVGDFLHLDLTLGNQMPRQVLFSEVSTGIKLTSAAGYGLYNVVDRDGLRVDLGGGARLMSANIDLAFRGTALRDYRSSLSDTWIDPLVATRISYGEDGRWQASLWIDGGGFGIGEASDDTWQVVALASYSVGTNWTLSGGWRNLSVDREYQGLPYDLQLNGPIFGASYRF
ncbi:hypothetical protein RM190_22830 [Paracoccus sp. CPCC 101403]|uniref:Outer membrane protein beta-barrel domain-containing protein n=2 Tax=Paracoccus broussonetiae TaxID=3075834 RepID=A0ABU3EKE0_9RHOB|nr:hypothetical protein [Paracoccus sp. CPCC 101403]MDT1064709.1 hypothetical protein [Paracoccus sp. CPCC 101403]